jgi:hypothetical protein
VLQPIHALMIVAAYSEEDRKREVEYFTRMLTIISNARFQAGCDDAARRGRVRREYFGFSDGISQPGIRGLTVASDPNKPDEGEPGQDLIASGEFVLDYPLERAHAWSQRRRIRQHQPRISKPGMDGQ